MPRYRSYADPEEALEVALALLRLGLWVPPPHYLAREGPGKSPTLTPPEVQQVFEYAHTASHVRGSRRFFQAEAEVRSPDWRGIGFAMWHIEEQWGEPSKVIITTAYRKTVFP